jgi:hypothetical protein
MLLHQFEAAYKSIHEKRKNHDVPSDDDNSILLCVTTYDGTKSGRAVHSITGYLHFNCI